MPLVKIETRRWMSTETKRRVFDEVHAALVSAFKIPEEDRVQRLIEYAPEDFEIRPGCGERYAIITISAFAGRSLAAKRTLYKEIVTRLEPLGVPRNDVFVIIDEMPMENCAVRGGIPASEVDFGFEVKV